VVLDRRWPSTSEVWKDNVFFDVGAISRTRGGERAHVGHSVIENVHGDVAIDRARHGIHHDLLLHHGRQRVAWRGPTVVTDTQSSASARCSWARVRAGGRSIVSRAPGQSLFAWGSRITGTAEVGAVENGLFVDSRMGPLSGPLTVVENGRVRCWTPMARR